MNDLDEVRAALTDAATLRGEVRLRGTATGSVRRRARQRGTTALGSGAAAVAVCVVVALLALPGGPDARRATLTPSGPRTLARSPAAGPSLPAVDDGPRTLVVPIEIARVEAEQPACPSGGGTVAAAQGPSCYVLDPAELTVREVADLEVAPAVAPSGTTTDATGSLLVTLGASDRSRFRLLTTDHVGERLAVVVAGRVYVTPVVAMPIRDGAIQLDLPLDALRSLIEVLGVRTPRRDSGLLGPAAERRPRVAMEARGRLPSRSAVPVTPGPGDGG